MRVLVFSENRFEGTPDGAVWTRTMASHSFWKRYLTVFSGVTVFARVQAVPRLQGHASLATGDGVEFVWAPHYVGPKAYLANLVKLRRAIARAHTASDAVILRGPGHVSYSALRRLRKAGQPFGLEVVGDPHDVFARGVVEHPLRGLFQWWFSDRLRRTSKAASAVAYVTAEALQNRYPAAPGAFQTWYSSVELPEAAFSSSPRSHTAGKTRRLLCVGSLEQMYKAPEIQVMAIRLLRDAGLDVDLTFIGDGRFRSAMMQHVRAAGLEGCVRFPGAVPGGDAIRSQLRSADLFLLPSRTEGLPRALLEAMAMGLPCVATAVGGIPEILPAEDLVPPGDAHALASKIAEVLADPARLDRMSAANLAKATEYGDAVLNARREQFYRVVLDRTSDWQGRHPRECARRFESQERAGGVQRVPKSSCRR